MRYNTPHTDEMSSLTLSAEQSLKQYVGLRHPPGYATLVNGPWGSGKTYITMRILEELRATKAPESKEKEFYISLFGVSSVAEIDDLLLAQLHPLAQSATARRVGRAASAVAKGLFRIDPSEVIEKLIDRKSLLSSTSGSLFVFDDLERTSIDIQEVFGYINSLVEHEDCRVIIIANEGEIPEKAKPEYARRKEKVVGRIVSVVPDTHSAFDSFLADVPNGYSRSRLVELKPELCRQFSGADTTNLRVLRRAMWDLDRIFEVYSEEIRKFPSGVGVLAKTISALSFEFHSGRLTEAEFRNRPNMVPIMFGFADDRGGASDVFAKLCNRYPGVRFDDLVLSDDVLVDLIVKGVPLSPRLNAELALHPLFSNSAPALWRQSWALIDCSDEKANMLAAEIDATLGQEKFDGSGPFLHLVSGRLLLADAGIGGKSRLEVRNSALEYVDSAAKRGILDHSSDFFSDPLSSTGFGGLAFQDQSMDFQVVFERLIALRGQTLARKADLLANELMMLARTSGDEFQKKIDEVSRPECIFRNVPILSRCSVDELVSVLLGLSRPSLEKVLFALYNRSEAIVGVATCEAELRWICDVAKILANGGVASEGMWSLRFRRWQSVIAEKCAKLSGK